MGSGNVSRFCNRGVKWEHLHLQSARKLKPNARTGHHREELKSKFMAIPINAEQDRREPIAIEAETRTLYPFAKE